MNTLSYKAHRNQIDQNHAEQEYKRGIVGRLAFLTRNAAKLVCVI